MSLEDDLRNLEKECWNRVYKLYFVAEADLPTVLCHYTSLAGLEGILRSGRIWATNVPYLNDPDELIHGQRMFEALIDKTQREAKDSLARAFYGRCKQNLGQWPSLKDLRWDYYCTSLTARRDDLSLYRAYSAQGAGYCIGFDTAQLVKNIAQIHWAAGGFFRLVKMYYDGNTGKTSFEEELLAAEGVARDLTERYATCEDNILRRLSSDLVRRASLLAFVLKEQGFQYEDEWRIITNPLPGLASLPSERRMRTKSRDGILVPYLEIPVTDQGNRHTALKEIYIGPELPYEKANNGLLKLLCELREDKGPATIVELPKIFPSSTALR